MKSLLNFLGALRFGFLLLVVIDIVLPAGWLVIRVMNDIEVSYTGWQSLPVLIAPVLAPILFVVLVFDIVMCSVQAADNPGKTGDRHRLIRRINLGFVALLALYWIPFFAVL